MIIEATERIERDAEGRYRLIDTACGLNEAITEAEAIEVLERRAHRKPALKALLATHFPMRHFHPAPAPDRTPTHKGLTD